jgi:hypothetical protein
MPRTRSAIIPPSSWQCQRCSHTNNSARNKKLCCSCQAWRDGTAPLSMCAHDNVCNKAGSIGIIGCGTAREGIAPLSMRVHGNASNKVGGVSITSCNASRDRIAPLSMRAHGDACNKAGSISIISCNAAGIVRHVGLSFYSSKNDPPSKALPPNVGGPKKCVLKRKSPSQDNGGAMIQTPLLKRLPPALQTSHSIITPNPPSQCRGVYGGFFEPAFTFAAKSLQHTTNQLQRWAREPDLGVKSFANSILLMSWSICVPYHGVLLDRAHNPCNEFVFCAVS